jgi:D-alanyl-D-alanine carboxypeptidase
VLDSTFFRQCEAAAERWEVPALALGFEHGERGSWLHAAGCAPETRFRIASLTKPMTATLALRLLDLDGTTGVWPDDVHVRHLLGHLSGFDCECGDLARFGSGESALEAVVGELATVRRLVGACEAWSYANTGYWLAGWLAARASGATYEDALAAQVLVPAGMGTAAFDEPEVAGTGRGASGEPYPRARRPSGGLVASIADLLAFARSQLADQSTDSLRVPLGRTPGGVYGLGYAGERLGGVDVWGHGGSYGGFEASLLLVPARGLAYVGLTSSGRGRQALREIEDLWFERVLDCRRPVAATVPLPSRTLAAFAGTYANSAGEARIVADGSVLEVDYLDAGSGFRTAATARPIGPSTFAIVGGDSQGDRFDFPLPDFLRFGSRLAERVA